MTAQPLAWLFPGQGAQSVGMGQPLTAASPAAQAVFDAADAALGFSLAELCFKGPQADLDDTINTQPALLTMSVAVLRALEEAAELRGASLPKPQFCAGHSLGEYSALVAAGSMAFEDALRLVRERGRLMKQAGDIQPGGMAALIGADDATAEAVATAAGVQVANFNAPGQIILSGSAEGIARLPEVAKAHGVRRVIPLAVSIAAHSALMGSVVEEFRAAVDATAIEPPRIPVIGNVHAQPLADGAAIRQELVEQLTASVRWTAGVEYMAAQGVTTFVELGPGAVLSNMVKRILKAADTRAIGTPDDIQAYLG